MEIKTIVEASEEEILDIIRANGFPQVDSLVALEELGNQVWVVDVQVENCSYELNEFVRSSKWPIYRGRAILNHLCYLGKLQAGTYNIDCTW